MLLNSPQCPGRPPNAECLFPSVRVPRPSSPVRGPPTHCEGWRDGPRVHRVGVPGAQRARGHGS